VLNRNEIRELLTMTNCITYMEEAFQLYSSHQVILPLRLPVWLSNQKDKLLGLMPGALSNSPQFFGVKVLSIFFHSSESHKGLVVLFEGEDGKPICLLEAGAITAIRTAACSGVATKYLMNNNNNNNDDVICAILGTGVQADAHLEAMICVLGERMKEMRIWGRKKENAEKFVVEQEKRYFGSESRYKNLKFKFKVVSTPKEAVCDADIINTCTSSKEPVLNGEWVKEGAHINAVGACIPSARELDTACVAKSKIFVDSMESCWNEAGDLLIPINQEKKEEIKKMLLVKWVTCC